MRFATRIIGLIGVAICLWLVASCFFARHRLVNGAPERVLQYSRALPLLETALLRNADSYERIAPERLHLNGLTAVLARKTASGVVSAEFHERGGFPVKHSGILYQSDDAPQADAKVVARWKDLRKIQKCWYLFSD